mmetsp:Transcript_76585/g.183487  ORF Transcript_76585/g.183487 Transcript_76585/m.183487 type:complete len:420 (+) Transcript_76585:80-1339(+)
MTQTLGWSVKPPEDANPSALSPKSFSSAKELEEPSDMDVLSTFSEPQPFMGERQLSASALSSLGGDRQLTGSVCSLSDEGLQMELEEVRRQLSEAQEIAEQERRRAALAEERAKKEEKEQKHAKVRQLIDEQRRKIRQREAKSGLQDSSQMDALSRPLQASNPQTVDALARPLQASAPQTVDSSARPLQASKPPGGAVARPLQASNPQTDATARPQAKPGASQPHVDHMLPPTGKHVRRLSPSPKGIKTFFKSKHERESSRQRRQEAVSSIRAALDQRKKDLEAVMKQAKQQKADEREMEERLSQAMSEKLDLEAQLQSMQASKASLETAFERLSLKHEDLLSRCRHKDTEPVQTVRINPFSLKRGRSDLRARTSGIVVLALLFLASAWHLGCNSRRAPVEQPRGPSAWLKRSCTRLRR